MRLPYLARTAGSKLVRGIPVRIRSGPNRRLRWSLASLGRGVHSGRFEADRIRALRAFVGPGDHVWDVGAHKGYVTMALASRVGAAGSVVAFEPSAMNLWFLRRHLEWNGFENVRVVPVAVGDQDGHERFGGAGSSVAYRLGRGSERVRVATLAALKAREGLPQPDLIKIDVEGSEGAVLRGAGDVLRNDTAVFVSVHGRTCYDECASLLSGKGYRLHESRALARRLADPSLEWGPDHELLAVGSEHSATEDAVRARAW